ncbi:Glycerophosphoryl diester phosphodiesterase [Entamoeba marina]
MNLFKTSFLLSILFYILIYSINHCVTPRHFINTNITLANHPALVSHRGGRGIYPENTLKAMKLSVANHQADMLETDIHITKDNEFIFIHDDTLDRTTNGRGYVNTKTLNELRELDFGYRFTNGSETPYRGYGIHCSTLYEAYVEFNDSKIPISVEIKDNNIEVIDVLVDYISNMPGSEEFMCFCCANHTMLQYFKKQTNYSLCYEGSEIDVALYIVSGALELSRLYYYFNPNTNRFFHAPFLSLGGINLMDKHFRIIHKEIGLEVMYFTINNKIDMSNCIGNSCDGITTDLPDDAEELLHVITGRDQIFKGFKDRIISTDAITTSWDCESLECQIVDNFTSVVPMKLLFFICLLIITFIILLELQLVIVIIRWILAKFQLFLVTKPKQS